MAAQERETSDHTRTAGSVGAAVVVAMVAAAVAVPVAAVAATVITAVVVTASRRDAFEAPSITDTRDGPERAGPEPATGD